MSKDILFQRVLQNKCPICLKVLEKTDKTISLEYNEAKLEICKKHIKFGWIEVTHKSNKAEWTRNFTPPTGEYNNEKKNN